MIATLSIYRFPISIILSLIFLLFASTFDVGSSEPSSALASLTWKQCLHQKAEWYRSPEALRIADNVLLYQHDTGGWPKNLDMAKVLLENEKQEIQNQKKQKQESTIDNGATFSQLIFLAKVYNASPNELYQEAFSKGLCFLLDIQYENGGWPQFPYRHGYYSHITFNDNAMIGVMNLLQNVGYSEEYTFVHHDVKKRAQNAVRKGIECILNCQIVVDGKRTSWCAQHDENTLLPAPARAYEKVSLSGLESVGIVRFLMGIETPNPEIIDAVQSAIRWFDEVKISGMQLEKKANSSLPEGFDIVILPQSSSPPLWARFYEIGTNRAIFCGRDGIVKYSLAEIEHERRIGYSWYSNSPSVLIEKEYPDWKKKLANPFRCPQ